MPETPYKPPPNPFIPGYQGTVSIDRRYPSGKPVNASLVPAPHPVPIVTTVQPTDQQQAAIDAATNYQPRVLSADDIAALAKAVGFKGASLVTAVAVALAESSGHTDAQGPHIANPESWVFGDQALGLWQILPAAAQSGGNGVSTGSAYDRTIDHSITGPRDARRLFLPAFNARSAYQISKGGTNWKPWSTYGPNGDGSYLQHTAEATAAVAALGALDAGNGATTTGDPYVDVTWLDGALLPVHLGGTAKATDFGAKVVAGSLDQSVKQPSELTLEVHDPDLHYLTSAKLKRGVRLQVNSQRFTITNVEIGDGGTGAHVTVHALPAGIAALMHTDPPTITGMQPGDYVGLLVAAVGVTYLPYSGKGIATSAELTAPQDVTRSTTDDVLTVLNPYNPQPATGKRTENAYEVIGRLSAASGYELWEDTRGIYWGPATSSTFSTALYVTWKGQPARSPSGAVRALGIPRVAFSTPGTGRYARIAGSFTIAPGDAGKVMLGQRVDMALGQLLIARPDVTEKQAAATVGDVGLLRITRINRDLGNLLAPVTVEFESAVNVTGSDAVAVDPPKPVGVPQPVLRGGTTNPFSSDVAVETATKAVGGTCEISSCMHTVGTWYGLSSSGWPRAIDGWNGTPASMRHPGDDNPPAGALVYWSGGSAGHVALAKGDGSVISTDAPQAGRVGIEPIAWFVSMWHKDYLGWAEPYFPHGTGR